MGRLLGLSQCSNFFESSDSITEKFQPQSDFLGDCHQSDAECEITLERDYETERVILRLQFVSDGFCDIDDAIKVFN